MRRLAATIACLAVALIVGGAPAAAGRGVTSPADFAISYERNGGLSGESASLVVHPGRHAVARTHGGRAGARTVRFRIAPARVRELERDLREAHFFRLGSRDPGTCADCFVYSIGYRGHQIFRVENSLTPQLAKVTLDLEALISANAIPANA
jgi:hypothetical protein